MSARHSPKEKPVVKQPFGKPKTPVIDRSECAATLSLVRVMIDNVVSRGDLPEDVLEHLRDFWEYLNTLELRSTERDSERVLAAIGTGLLPSFPEADPADAGESLMKLISLGAKKPPQRAA